MNPGAAGERVARRYLVTGRVQGVGFRWFVREHARALGLSGLVRNQPDGSVQVDAAGTPGQLAQLEEVLTQGPNGAQVAAVEVLLRDREAEAELGHLPLPFAIAR